MPEEERKIVDAPPPGGSPVRVGCERGGRFGSRLANLDADIVVVARQVQLLGVHVDGVGQQQQRQVQPWAAQLAEVAGV